MSNGGYVNLNIQISTINHEALLVGDVPVRLYIEPTWNTVGYKLDEHNIIAVQKSLGGKTREIKTGQVDEINDEVVATDTAAKSALDNWTKAEQTQTPENHKLILKPQKDISGNYVPYEFLDGEYALPNNIEIIGVMDDSGTVPTLTPYTLSVSTIENGNIGFAGVNFVATAATESSTELQKQGGTIVVQNDSKGNAAVLDSLSFLGCGFVNTNVYVHNKATVNKVITHQCTFVTSKQTRDWQYEVSAEGRKTYWYKWTSVLLEGDVESVSVSCNNFYGALYNAVQVSNGKKNLHKFNLSNNAFYDIENRVAHVVASKDTNDIVVSNNHIGKSCNLEPDLGGREDTTEKGGGWAAHINQLMYINSVGEKDMVLTEGQYLKFKLLSQNNTYDTEQSEITFDYISEEKIEPGQWSQVAFLATKPGSPF